MHDDPRESLLDAATDYVLEHGLVGLSLRPLAAELATSDRMLIYHFGSKDALVASVVERSNDRAIDVIRGTRRSRTPAAAVRALWRLWQRPALRDAMRVYTQSASLGLLGHEPYLSAAMRCNERWEEALREVLVAAGVPPRRSTRVVDFVDATFYGLLLDVAFEPSTARADRVVADLASAVTVICDDHVGGAP